MFIIGNSLTVHTAIKTKSAIVSNFEPKILQVFNLFEKMIFLILSQLTKFNVETLSGNISSSRLLHLFILRDFISAENLMMIGVDWLINLSMNITQSVFLLVLLVCYPKKFFFFWDIVFLSKRKMSGL